MFTDLLYSTNPARHIVIQTWTQPVNPGSLIRNFHKQKRAGPQILVLRLLLQGWIGDGKGLICEVQF